MSSFDFGDKNTVESEHIGATITTESVEEELLGVTLDKHLDFKNHENSLCKKLVRSCIYLHAFQTMYMFRN